VALTAPPAAGPGTAAADAPGPLPPLVFEGPRRRRGLGNRRQKAVAGVLIVGALSFLVFRGLTNALDYYLTANQAVAQRAHLGETNFRIQGTVLPDLRQVGTDLQFSITSHNVDVKVVNVGSPPQLFRAGLPVVLDGHWQGNTFASSQIMVQHGSSYVEAHPARANAATARGARAT
jgi:cytochrome c-type biogenesis protein CcmE